MSDLSEPTHPSAVVTPSGSALAGSPIVKAKPLGFPWDTIDPFLFCAYHDDAYPKGNANMGPAVSLAGRQLGQDFSRQGGWSMYHGHTVPGFPSHPHRGFETVTIVRKGLIDHADSLGAAARFGQGDVQWLTAGSGIVHAEMFPLLATDQANPLELFQIWLNLPAASKMAPPHFTMFWSQEVVRQVTQDDAGRSTELAVIAGRLQDADAPPPPPPDSWAAQLDADVAIWTIRMDPGARWTLPATAGEQTQRSLYFFKGEQIEIDGDVLTQHAALELVGRAITLVNHGAIEAEFLLLQGKPIGEPVAQYGPFVMNTQAEIRQTVADYQRTQFGGWPWPDSGPVHGHEPARFARYPDGRETRPASDT
jgi:redox-sensitive bicupin YhaK (pirin superfamily)